MLDRIPAGAIESFAGSATFSTSPTSPVAGPSSIWAADRAWTRSTPHQLSRPSGRVIGVDFTIAAQQDEYRRAIETGGLRIIDIRPNPYEFISDQARNASGPFGVKSVCLLVVKASRQSHQGPVARELVRESQPRVCVPQSDIDRPRRGDPGRAG